MPRERTGHSKHPLPATQEKTLHMGITRWSIPKSGWLYSLQPRWKSAIPSAKTRPGTDCDSDHELLIAKFRLKLKKVGITIRPFRYDLNQTPWDYTVEVTNRFNGLDLIDRVPDELRTEVCNIVQETGIKTNHPQEKEMQKNKMGVWGGLTNSCEMKRSEKQRRKGKVYSSECRVPKNSQERWESLPQCKEIEENNRMAKTRVLCKKIRDTKGTFHAKMGTIKDINGMDLTEAADIKKRWQE